jgi:5-methylcytosine-specific restriction endonuclease McrA
MDISKLALLSNSELLARVKEFVHRERHATAALIAHLGEVEERKLYLEEGRSSLFTYCTQVLHLSEHAAYNRIEAARLVRRFPAVLSGLERGHVHLAAVKLLAPLLTPENHRDLLAAAKHKSKREVEELVARWRPQPDVATSVRKLPGARPRPASAGPSAAVETAAVGVAIAASMAARTAAEAVAEAAAAAGTAAATDTVAVAGTAVAGGAAAAGGTAAAGGAAASAGGAASARATATERAALPRTRLAAVVALAAERYKVQFTIDAATRDKLYRAQELLQHQLPGSDIGKVIELALDRLVRELEKAKFAATARPRQRTRAVDRASRYIPAAVKRAVWHRDQGRCAFVAANGDRCTERGRLEFDHVHPHGDDGLPTLANVRLLCRAHNQHQARQFYGPWTAEGRTPDDEERPAVASAAHSEAHSAVAADPKGDADTDSDGDADSDSDADARFDAWADPDAGPDPDVEVPDADTDTGTGAACSPDAGD